ncbi:MAG: cytochrome c3 family protein [Steroidobacteraceae bacterium]
MKTPNSRIIGIVQRGAGVRRRWMLCLLALALGALAPAAQSWSAPAQGGQNFDHLTTGFELIGRHRDLPCETCHVNAIFKGTPRDCASCHGVGTQVRAIAKSATHILSSNRCEACHTPIAFIPAVKFDHTEALGSCSTCHNGVQASGKGPTHIDTDLECNACHSTLGWAGAIFSHVNVAGKCASCHDGVKATGMPPTHIPTGGAACDSCHSPTNFVSWAGTSMNHAAVTSMSCASCHETGMSFVGVTIVTRPPAPHPMTGDCGQCHLDTISFKNGTSMPPDHIPTTQTCSLCHANPADYSVYMMDHQGITNNCAQCHASGLSFGKLVPPALKVPPTDHIPFGNAACEGCHSASNFTTFQVANTSPPMNHASVPGVACATCHASGLNFVGAPPTVAPPTTHIPFGTAACESCHAPANFTSFVFANASGLAPPSMVHSVVASTACSTCHEAGKSFAGSPGVVTRPPTTASGEVHPANGECSNCHTSTVSFKGATNYPGNHIPLPSGASANCAACHGNSADFAIYTMDHSVVTSTCAVCHGAGLSFANMAPPTLKVLPGNHVPVGTAACDSCHSPTNFTTFVISNKSPPMNHAMVPGVACATCHARGLNFVGTPATVAPPSTHIPFANAACETCHAPADFTTFVITNKSPPMNHAAVASLSCATCHARGLSFIGAPATVVEPTSHIPVGSATCQSCHAPANFTSFVINNASGTAPPSMVHSVVSSTPCSTCHEAGKSFVGTPAVVVRPVNKADGTAHVPGGECNTCHFNTTSFKGASDLPATHIPLPAADNNNCALCHTTPGTYSVATMNHVNITGNCAQCHASSASFGNLAPPRLKVPPANHVPFGTAACESCHSPSDFNSFVITNKSPPMNHAVVASMTCNTCHARGLTFVGTPATVVEPGNHIPIGTTACQNCHAPANFTTFVIANAVPPMDHTGFTTNCIACHGAGLTFVGTPAVKVLPGNHIPTGTIGCELCHSTTSFGTFVVPNASVTAAPGMVHSAATSIVCSNCHEKGKTFVGTPPVVVRPVNKADGSPHVVGGECNTCHFNTTSFKGATDLPANHIPLPAADANNCLLCHTTGNYSLYVMNHVNIVNNCAQCHAYGLSFANISAPALVQPPAGATGHIPSNLPNGTTELACELCHTPTVFTTFAGTIMRHVPVRGMTCMSCHEIGMKWKTNTGVRLWVRDSANHYKGQDCGGSGCHSARDRRALRPGVGAVQAGVKAAGAIVPRAAAITGAAISRPGGFDHRRIIGQTCVSCHDQASGMGKPAGHLASSNDCAACHSTLAWLPVGRVDHSQVIGSCASCHNGTIAAAKSTRHVASADTCETCHTTNAWAPARFDHGAVTAASCASCHDAVHAIGKPVTHIPTAAGCDTCHGTLAWKPAKLDHSTLSASCAACHNGASATGLSAGHLQTRIDCATCHSYPDWSVVRFTHVAANYPGEHRAALTCVACHTTNTDQVPYLSAADAGSCGACHAKDFKADLHLKTVDGQKYTASELRDCSGACHVYSDATRTTPAKLVPGPYHRVADDAFKH